MIATVFNITKPVQLDDSIYLEITQKLVLHPAHIMSELIAVGGRLQPIWQMNQPHALYWLYAVVFKIAGNSQLALHALMALFTFLAIWGFTKLLRRFPVRHAQLLLFLFVLGPAFIPSQNLMTDIPLLAALLWVSEFFLASLERSTTLKNVSWGLILSIACLIKYTALAMIPVILIILWRTKKWRSGWPLIIPLAALVGWSIYNLFDYGHVHLLQRSLAGGNWSSVLAKLFNFITILGAVSLFSLTGVKKIRGWIWPLVAILVGLICWLWLVFYDSSWTNLGLRFIFLVSGICVLAQWWQSRSSPDNYPLGLLWWWFVWFGAFTVILAPFMAVRHVLLVLPPVIIFFGLALPSRLTISLRIVSAVTIIIGLWLAASDWVWADVYRHWVPRLNQQHAPATIAYAGHWGFEWYALQAGWQPVSAPTHRPPPSLLVVPTTAFVVPGQVDYNAYQLLASYSIPSTPLTYIRSTRPWPSGGYYGTDQYGLPWTFTWSPLEKLRVYMKR